MRDCPASGGLDVGARELVPGAAADSDRADDQDQGDRQRDQSQDLGVARHRHRPCGHPVLGVLEPPQADVERQRERHPGDQQEQRHQALVHGAGDIEVFGDGFVALHVEECRDGADRPGGERRQQPQPVGREDQQQPGADRQRQQAAARVGEVEGEERRRDPRQGDRPQPSGRRTAAHPQQHRRADRRAEPVGVPVFERVPRSGAASQRLGDWHHMGQETRPEDENYDDK